MTERRSFPWRQMALGAALGAALAWRFMRGGSPSSAGVPFLERMTHAGYPPPMLLSLLLWVGIGLYWEISARGAGENRSAESRGSRLLHLSLVSAGQLLVLVPIPGLRARFLPPAAAVVGAGLALEVLSVAFMVWSRRTLGRNWSGTVAEKVGHELVRTGPYRWLRHPIYTGMLGLACGTALVSGEVRALLGIVVMTVAFVRKIRLEERLMGDLFQGEYEDYRKSTWGLIPWVG